jgi:hypothetical protein
MCTSFVYRKENVLVGMNFDNDGKKFRVSARPGFGYLVSVEIGGNFYPSFGVSASGLFINNLMVDSNGEGRYKRQSAKRWVNSSLIDKVMGGNEDLDSLRSQIGQVEIVNGPFLSTHNLIVDPAGNTLVVEPGRRCISSSREETGWYVMTNFPLSEYVELVPGNPSGTGADRFNIVNAYLSSHEGPLTVDRAFDLLGRVRQHGPEWKTDLSMVFEPDRGVVSWILADKSDTVEKFSQK